MKVNRPKMKCPSCGAEMNMHAEKIDYSTALRTQVDPDFGGAIEECHTCPKCGTNASREGITE